jgi:myosin-5
VCGAFVWARRALNSRKPRFPARAGINYTNERLHQEFINAVFTAEMAVYDDEGVERSNITFTDNTIVLEAMTIKPNGVFPMLDEECIVPRGSNEKYLAKLLAEHHESAIIKPQGKRAHEMPSQNIFIVVHYAGDVGYDVDGFLEKNKVTSTLM